MRKLVMLLGMPRAATTFFYHHLDRHPDIFVPYKRKTNYFSLHFDAYPQNWFFEHFEAAGDTQVCLDTETIGFVDKRLDVLDNIEKVLAQNSQFILCVREPGEWVYSLYNQIKTFQPDIVPFKEFVSCHYQLTEDDITFSLNYENGDLKKRICEIIERFGDRLLLLDYRDMQRDPNSVLIKIETFMNLSPWYKLHPVKPYKINASDRKNILFLTKLMRDPQFIRYVGYLPVGFVKTIRKWYDKLGVNKRQSLSNPNRERDLKLAKARFATDVQYYHQLFSVDD